MNDMYWVPAKQIAGPSSYKKTTIELFCVIFTAFQSSEQALPVEYPRGEWGGPDPPLFKKLVLEIHTKML